MAFVTYLISGIFLNESFSQLNQILFFTIGTYISGMHFAPVKNSIAKWLLIGTLFAFGLILLIAWFTEIEGATLWHAIPMLIIVIVMSRIPPEDID